MVDWRELRFIIWWERDLSSGSDDELSLIAGTSYICEIIHCAGRLS